ncbi:MAG TPA: hypothetical protein VF692_13485 [Pyrinomonadaceae bacterium]|jgi:hypothetical protein
MKNIISKTSFRFFFFFILLVISVAFAKAQTARPELSVSGFRLGEETENAKRLQSFSPRYDEETGQPKYLFYNEFGTQVLSLTALSKERPFLLVRIEVFAVGKSYQQKHYQLNDTGFFVTESGFFIGERPSATSMLFAVANVTGAKDVIGKKGSPQSDEKEGKARTISYRLSVAGESVAERAQFKETALGSTSASTEFYKAEYLFVKNRLRRFSFSIDAASLKIPKF